MYCQKSLWNSSECLEYAPSCCCLSCTHVEKRFSLFDHLLPGRRLLKIPEDYSGMSLRTINVNLIINLLVIIIKYSGIKNKNKTKKGGKLRKFNRNKLPCIRHKRNKNCWFLINIKIDIDHIYVFRFSWIHADQSEIDLASKYF